VLHEITVGYLTGEIKIAVFGVTLNDTFTFRLAGSLWLAAAALHSS
jgi:hypothetical protein